MYKLKLLFPPGLCAIVFFFIFSGCSGSNVQPVSPSPNELDVAMAPDEFPDNHLLWGYWQCALNMETMEIEAVPARTASLHFNIVGRLNQTLGISVDIDQDESDQANGYFVLTIDLTHPYPGASQFAGFDVRGIFITTAGLDANGLPLPGDLDPVLLNADGFTRWWNPTEFPVPGLLGYEPGILGKDPPPATPLVSAINPYMQFADGLYYSYSVTHLKYIQPTSEFGRGVFRAGSINSRLYEIQFPVGPTGPEVYFNYAVDVSWQAPANNPPENIPNDFPLGANAQEAWVVDAEVTGNSLWAAGGPLAGGELSLVIELWDWQGWLGGYDGEVGALKLVSPYCVFDEGIIPDVDEDGVGGAELTATVPGLPSVHGTIPVWVGVIAPGTNYQQMAVPAPDEPVAAYTLITVEVAEAECQDNSNDDCNSAELIGPADSKDGLLCLTVDENDWYSFSVPPFGSAGGTAHLYTYATSDLNLLFYQGCPPSLIDYSANTGTADEEITFSGLGAGDYYFQVLAVQDGNMDPRPYTITTDITGIGEDCTTDNDNASENADSIALDGSSSDTVCMVGDPSDWYTFHINPDVNGTGTIDLDNFDYANNDIAVFSDPAGGPLYVGNSGGTADEHLEITSLPPGEYYIQVEAKDDTPTGNRAFTLDLNLQEIVSNCDDEDGNNIPEDAIQISLVASDIGTVCYPSDPDWYIFDVPENGVSGTITLSASDLFDNDLALFDDPAASPIDESAQTGTMDEIISVSGLAEGPYYIRVTAASDPGGVNQDYTLTTNMTSQMWGPTDLWVHAHIVRTTQGSNPATTPENVEAHIAWANEYYGIWVDGSVHLYQISYIDHTAWLALTTSEATQMFNQNKTGSGALHVFYVNDTPDMPGAAAYAYMECEFENQDHDTGFVIMTDYADDMVLAHEMGHAIGLLADTYWLDWYNCSDITYCPSGPSDIYCDASDAQNGNLMYWPVGSNINDYWWSNEDLIMDTSPIDSQSENVMYFHTNYPDAFDQP